MVKCQPCVHPNEHVTDETLSAHVLDLRTWTLQVCNPVANKGFHNKELRMGLKVMSNLLPFIVDGAALFELQPRILQGTHPLPGRLWHFHYQVCQVLDGRKRSAQWVIQERMPFNRQYLMCFICYHAIANEDHDVDSDLEKDDN
ncbi:hypothetical protein L484_027964 [Morus notabilis]|uniref:Uncharacterized protein n=1 Tax=Morus notabilis TaxID=981085 RepID=W9SW54_9ROSA|nr:hypothetical protein L484_027964 [Morus notabilis]